MPYTASTPLRDILQTNLPLVLTIKRRGKAYPSKYKEGENNYQYIFTDAKGTDIIHYATEREEEIIKDYQPGEQIQVLRQEKVNAEGQRYYFNTWGNPGSAEMKAEPTLRTPTAEKTQEKRIEAAKDAEEQKWDRIALSKIVHEFMKVGYASGKAPDLCVLDAKELTRLQYQAVEELWNERKPSIQ